MPVLPRRVRPRPRASCPFLFGITAVIGCSRSDSARPVATARGPADSLIPAGPYGNSVRRGRALLVSTQDSLPTHVGNKLRCTSCHLDEGRRENGAWVGGFARYPQYPPPGGVGGTIEYLRHDRLRRRM